MWSKVGAVLWRWLEWLGRSGEYGWVVRQMEAEEAARARFDRTVLDAMLAAPAPVRTFVTPWGEAAAPSNRELLRRMHFGFDGWTSKAEMCVAYRDHLEAEGHDPREAMDLAIEAVRAMEARRG